MKVSALLSISFVLLTIIGTLMHEMGHIVPAKLLGYETTLHYGSMRWERKSLKYSNQLFRKYTEKAKVPQLELDKLDILKKREIDHGLWISLGGPIQTMLTGFLGIFILYIRRDTLKTNEFDFLDWIGVFLAFFWSRQIFNLFTGTLSFLLGNASSPFGGDEAKISTSLNLHAGTIGIITGLISVIICSYVVFKVVPRRYKVKFMIFGLLGSIGGYILWFYVLGPALLP